jgi:hypothetical protein
VALFLRGAFAAPNGAAAWWLLSSPSTTAVVLRHLRDPTATSSDQLAQAITYGRVPPSPPLLNPSWLAQAVLARLIATRQEGDEESLLQQQVMSSCRLTQQSQPARRVDYARYPCTRPPALSTAALARLLHPPDAITASLLADDHDVAPALAVPPSHAQPHLRHAAEVLFYEDSQLQQYQTLLPEQTSIGRAYVAAVLRSLGLHSPVDSKPAAAAVVRAFANPGLVGRIAEFAY